LENKFVLEVFNPIVIEKLFDEHSTGRVNHGKKLWALLMVAIWDKNK
jgi:asparagine synthase (glutamine-hydrolysing)